jgi:hypothetical protein
MEDDLLLPLGAATASDIRDIKQPGLVLPIREQDQRLLITEWDDKIYAVMLTGEYAFLFFPVSLQSPHTGLFIPTPEILVDFASATDARNRDGDVGLLILEQNSLSVIASQAGSQMAQPQPVPLWKSIEGGSEAARVAFTRWAIGIHQGENYRILWERSEPTRSFYEA